MRYIGNKESMVEEIDCFIESRVESEEPLTLFDAFWGTGAGSDRLKNKFNLIINDNLKWATVYTAGRLYAPSCHFERLGFDPFAFLNQSDEKVQGFIYKNYAPTESSRMYFAFRGRIYASFGKSCGVCIEGIQYGGSVWCILEKMGWACAETNRIYKTCLQCM